MTDGLKAISAEIEAYADDVFSGRKTLLQIERHLSRKGCAEESISIMMELIQDAVSRRKKGNCKAEYSDEIVFMNRDCECEDLKCCPNCGAKMDGGAENV